MSSCKYHCATLLLSLCLAGCKAHAPAADSTSPANASSAVGPSQDDIQKSLIKELPPYISEHCKGNKQALLDSVPSIKYKLRTNELVNDFHTYQVVRSYGTLYWAFKDKALGVDPSIGSRQVVMMSNEGAADPDRTIKWAFLGFGPYSEMLTFTQDKHIGVTCDGF